MRLLRFCQGIFLFLFNLIHFSTHSCRISSTTVMASLHSARHPHRLPTITQNVDKTGARVQIPKVPFTGGLDPRFMTASPPKVKLNGGASMINRDMFQIYEVDYIFLSLSPLETTDAEPRWLDTDYFLLTSNDKELGHEVYVSYRYALSQVLHQPVTHLTMLNFLQKWLSVTGVRLFSLKFNLYCWPAESLTGVLSIIFEHIDRIESMHIQGSDRHVKQFFIATNLTSHESPVLNSFPHVVNKAPNFSSFNSLTFSNVITDRDCSTLLRFCCRIETMTCHHVVKAGANENLSTPQLIRARKVATLPYLKHLRIVLTDFDTTLLLEHLSCPLLSNLELSVVRTNEQSILRMQQFLMRRMSNEPLGLLSICEYRMRVEMALTFLVQMNQCRWGPSSAGIESVCIYSSLFPRALVEELPASWNNTPCASKHLLLKYLFDQYNGRVETPPRFNCVGWGPECLAYISSHS